MNATVLSLQDVTVAYGRHPAVHHLSGAFASGSLTGIVGPNGAGKSTLLKAVMGQLPLSTGRIRREGLRPADIGYLPQAAEIDRSFPISVGDMVALGAWRHVGLFGGLTRQGTEAARAAVAAVGLEGFERRPIAELSTGQFQRVLFARLVLQDPKLVLLDEPFASIDARTTADLLAIIHRWHGEGRTVAAVVHDIAQVREYFPQTLLIAREPVAWGPTADVLSTENLRQARAMAEAWDDDAALCRAPEPDRAVAA
ncbi:metal ABC transporter ATP-binding protein [Aureimonas leprariae]|uniref:ABC transporter ATP-binding protein n=1 Tax=Plantimonas leprariae TaxID=2615207 RepID=A0A7V7PKQ2_9HYPH|nr:ABC transporter ATP-binding protein [Aureimonas leprariae]KAB0676423.1 ABC transporter ATP-binding protein [Aureimonas leprariae]